MKIFKIVGCRLIFFIFAFFIQITELSAQNTLDLAGLDNTSLPSVAYAMRKLSSAYTGFALQVRRSSDNATQDIGFTAGGDLDATALTNFVGASNGFVTIWYDQSGNSKNLTQSTASRQPWIVHNGVIDTENGRPFIRFYGHNGIDFDTDMLSLSADMTTTGQVTVVNKFASGGDGFLLGYTSGYNWHGNNTGGKLFISYAASSVLDGSVWQNGTAMSPLSAVFNTTLMVNTVSPQSPSAGTTWNNIGSDRNGIHDTNLGGGYAELITFSVALPLAARIALEKNQGEFFTIPLSANYLDRYGAYTSSTSNLVNRFGAGGGAGMRVSGEMVSRNVPAAPVTDEVTFMSSSGARLSASLSSTDGANTTVGFCWGTAPNPTISGSNTAAIQSTVSFSASITGLTAGTYYVRSYARNNAGTTYGNEVSFIHLAVGFAYQGGKVAYIYQEGDPGYVSGEVHGLIADISDQAAKWGQEGLPVSGADGTALGTGLQNTIDIMAGDASPGNAARICRGVTINGYSDWYLPSKDELNKLYLNKALIGGFNDVGWYFSSTEGDSAVYAWYQDFSNGTQAGTGAHKDWVLSVRAIRSF